MDALRQALFGISLGTAAARSHLDHEEFEQAREALDYVAQATRQAYRLASIPPVDAEQEHR